jgi:c(7)-type cytochrome triheme protein
VTVRRPTLDPTRALLVLAALASLGAATPDKHGRVVLDLFSSKAGVPPVGFDHWRHRRMYTCRVCHVDVGFAMKAGETRISASTNRGGFHCGACHDGKRKVGDHRFVFPACDGTRELDPDRACGKCHVRKDAADLRMQYAQGVMDLPRDRFGAVDWEKAEEEGKVAPRDVLEGVSIPRAPLKMDRDVVLKPRKPWMADVVFSHRRHAFWNGCEVCHPEIYPIGVRYSMVEIRNGQGCGVCHSRVAFPIADCERCHGPSRD